ncbi:hypothetical protein PSPO01_13508 [Paraphaeosphaeria sporulosa]
MGTSSSWWANHQAAGTPPLSDTRTPLLAIQRGGMTRWARTTYRWEDGFKTQPEVSVDVEFKALQTSECATSRWCGSGPRQISRADRAKIGRFDGHKSKWDLDRIVPIKEWMQHDISNISLYVVPKYLQS